MSRVRYAVGHKAWGICARSGKRVYLKDMVEDGQTGMLVAKDWYEPKHPQETVEVYDDPVALYRPAPDPDPSQKSQFDEEDLWPGTLFNEPDLDPGEN